jgi:hypothetical protein
VGNGQRKTLRRNELAEHAELSAEHVKFEFQKVRLEIKLPALGARRKKNGQASNQV